MSHKNKLVYQLNDLTETDPRDEMVVKMKETVYAIEANSFELNELWLKHSMGGAKYLLHADPMTEARMRSDWKQDMSGWLPCIGRFNGGGNTKYPVSLSMHWYIINGRRVLFFHQSGTYCNHDMSRAWIGMHMPHLFPNGIERVGLFGDAGDMYSCLQHIAAMNKPQEQ